MITWQERMSRLSLKKRAKFAALGRLVGRPSGKKCLEIGCDLGVTSRFLRRLGGWWVSADVEEESLAEAAPALGGTLVQFAGKELPFADGRFDLIVMVDFLEHIDDDAGFLHGVSRLARPGAEMVVTAPRLSRRGGLRRAFGLRPEYHGHIREGYSSQELSALLERAGWRVVEEVGFSRFFTELIESAVNWTYLFVLRRGKLRKGIKGTLSPRSRSEFASHRLAYRAYAVAWPLLWLLSRLDWFLFFTPGYCIGMRAKKL